MFKKKDFNKAMKEMDKIEELTTSDTLMDELNSIYKHEIQEDCIKELEAQLERLYEHIERDYKTAHQLPAVCYVLQMIIQKYKLL